MNNETNHAWHVWMNRRQTERQKAGEKWEHSLYEFKSLLQFLTYGHQQIQRAFEGKLRTTHRQCSHSAPEPIADNCLRCCLGQEVTTCDILVSIQSTFNEERERVMPFNGSKPYSKITDEEVYQVMAATCAWHIYTKATGAVEDGWHGVDTSEGHLLDESDRRFWRNVYESMAQQPPEDDEPRNA
jgi:hypothetical protein